MDQVLAYAANGVYLVVWGALLVHCLRKRAFFPVFGPGHGTRILWLATFLFFNPILTFFYLLFGVFAPARARRTALRTLGTVTLVAMTAVVFHLPSPAVEGDVRVVGEAAPDDAVTHEQAFRFRLGRLITATRTGTTLGQWSPAGATHATAEIAIFCGEDDLLLTRIAWAAQDRLAAAPGVKTVTCYPAGRYPAAGEPVPDIAIHLSMPERGGIGLPLSRQLTGRIRWLAAAADIHPGRGFSSGGDSKPCTNRFRLDGELEVKSAVDLAFATTSARYDGLGAQLGGEVGQSIAASLEAMAKAHGVTPSLPAVVRGPYRAPPDPASLGFLDAETIFSGPTYLQHARTVWRFRLDGERAVALAKLRAERQAEGWQAATTCTKHELHFTRDGRSLRVHPLEHEDAYVARYDDFLDANGVAAALDEVLATETSLAGLMMFHGLYAPDQKARLRVRLKAESAGDALEWFRLARVWKAVGDKAMAVHALRAAVVYGECCDEWPESSQVRSLARELGDEDLARTQPGAALCRAVGFVPVEADAPVVVREIALGEAAYFARTTDGPGFFALMVTVLPREGGEPQFRCKMTERQQGNAWIGRTAYGGRVDGASEFLLANGRLVVGTERIGEGRYRARVRLESTSAR